MSNSPHLEVASCSRVPAAASPANDAFIDTGVRCERAPRPRTVRETIEANPMIAARRLTRAQEDMLLFIFLNGGCSTGVRQGTDTGVIDFLLGERRELVCEVERVRRAHKFGYKKSEIYTVHTDVKFITYSGGRLVVTKLGALVARCLVSRVKDAPSVRLEEESV